MFKTVFIFGRKFRAIYAPERSSCPSQGWSNDGVTLELSVSVEHHDRHKKETKQKGQDQTNFANLVFKHWRILRHKVDIDIPGPVANHHHQAQDEEEYEEVRGLGVGAIQQT